MDRVFTTSVAAARLSQAEERRPEFDSAPRRRRLARPRSKPKKDDESSISEAPQHVLDDLA